jgi:ATP-dependent RNA helicase RhlE
MALEGFKDGTYRVLVATDIAARGIDVAEIGHVVNFDLPHVPEDYVHRVGRTARAAASGRASSFSSPEEQPQLTAIERLVRAPIPRAEVPRDAETFKAEVARTAEAHAAHGQPAQRPASRARPARPGHAPRPRRDRPAGEGARTADAAPAAGHGGKPRLVGSWGPKRRR